MDYKKYFVSLNSLILFSLFVFLFSVIYGYFSAVQSPEQAIQVLDQFKEIFGPILAYSSLIQFSLVFLNNAFSLFLTISLGIAFGIFPVLSLFSNGSLVGIFAYFWVQKMPLSEFFFGIIPHGIIEIPILLIGSAIGLRLGRLATEKTLFKLFPEWSAKNLKPLKDEQGKIMREKKLKAELSLAIKFSLRYLIPFLVLAAAIEIFITPLLF